MSFQVHGLPRAEFSALFDLTDEQLVAQNARRVTVNEFPGTPCRISLMDADVGETVILLNYEHHSEPTPYRASHAVFVRECAADARIARDEIPDVLSRRLISVRAYSSNGDMIDADVVDGQSLRPVITEMFTDESVDYLHLHNAKRGCFAAKVTR